MPNWVLVLTLIAGGLIPLATVLREAEREMSSLSLTKSEVKFWCVIATGMIVGFALNFLVYLCRPDWWVGAHAMGPINWVEGLFALLLVAATSQRRRQLR